MSSGLNKKWISSYKTDSMIYQIGLLDFFNFLLRKDGAENKSVNKKKFYSCPCRAFCNEKGKVQCDEIFSHLLQFGMDRSYKTWYYHGEEFITKKTIDTPQSVPPIDCLEDEFDQTSFPTSNTILNDDGYEGTSSYVLNPPDGSEKLKETKYERLKRLAYRPLYPSSHHSIMDALLKRNDLKSDFNLLNGATEGCPMIIKELIPTENSLGFTFHEMKCTLKEVEINCISYDVCINVTLRVWITAILPYCHCVLIVH